MTHYSGSLTDMVSPGPCRAPGQCWHEPPLTAPLLAQRNAYMVAAGVIGGLYILCAIILSVGVREKRGEAAGVRGGTGLLEEGCCTDPAGEAKSGASHPGSLGPGGGGQAVLGSARSPGEALQSGSAAGRSTEHPRRVAARPRGLSSVCWQIKLISHSFSWPRSLVPAGASPSEVGSKVQNFVPAMPLLCACCLSWANQPGHPTPPGAEGPCVRAGGPFPRCRELSHVGCSAGSGCCTPGCRARGSNAGLAPLPRVL